MGKKKENPYLSCMNPLDGHFKHTPVLCIRFGNGLELRGILGVHTAAFLQIFQIIFKTVRHKYRLGINKDQHHSDKALNREQVYHCSHCWKFPEFRSSDFLGSN